MNQRGFTLIEVLVAAATFAVILIAVSAFYVSATRVDQENSAQIFLQRQATLVIDEMRRQIQPATDLQITNCGGADNSVQVKNANEPDPDNPTGCGATSTCTYCFHRDGAGTGLLEDRPGGQWDLLSGAPATLSITSGTCAEGGGFCPSEVRHANNCFAGAAITLRLRFRYPETFSSYQTMTFPTTIAGRNLPSPVFPATTCP